MRTHGTATRPHALVDLYVPARLGPVDQLQALAAKAGLDAIVVVAEDAFELPNAELMTAVNGNGGPRVLVAPMVSGPGYRFALFLPSSEVNLESIEASGDPRVVQAAVGELGGVALAACPRQGAGGDVMRTPPRVDGKAGVIALSMPGSRLGRDLDLEDAAIAERPILGASGPFAALGDLGRYATLLPVDVRGDLVTVGARVLGALGKGLGCAVEIESRAPSPEQRRPDPREGRGDDAERSGQGGEGGKRRRRRRRSKG